MESIISIMVFSILVASVTMILTVAMRWTGQSFDEAYNRQSAANAAAGVVPAYGSAVTVNTADTQVFFSVGIMGEFGLIPAGTVPQGVTVRDANGITAFTPIPETVTGP